MHWYDSDGLPAYEVEDKKGNMRPTTLRDARKLNLVPSVTTVMAVAAKPGLDIYKEEQLAKACYELRKSKLAYENWKKEVVYQSKQHSKKAASRGTELHDRLEQYFISGELSATDEEFIAPVIELLTKEFGDTPWEPERSFTHKDGFGGKVDLSSREGIILDFKTKDTDDISKMVSYDEHGMQTAAYAVGLGFTENYKNPGRYNLFISTQVPGLVKLVRSEDFIRDWGMFKSLLDFWQLKNKYVPEVISGQE